jgi:hypothetical protein
VGFRDLTSLNRHYAGQAGQLVNDFYLPVLSQAMRYDRQSGCFDSALLVQIAAGLSAFIANIHRQGVPEQPPMRSITGTTWGPDDIEAYRRGLDILQVTLEWTSVPRLTPTDAERHRLGLHNAVRVRPR